MDFLQVLSPVMVLFFGKTTAGQARVLNLDAGTIIPENGLMALTTDCPTEEDFQKMAKGPKTRSSKS